MYNKRESDLNLLMLEELCRRMDICLYANNMNLQFDRVGCYQKKPNKPTKWCDTGIVLLS